MPEDISPQTDASRSSQVPLYAPRGSGLFAFVALMAAALLANIYMVFDYLLALLIGGILAMLANPAYMWLRGKRWSSIAAAIAVSLGLVILAIGPLFMLSIIAARQGWHLIEGLIDGDGSWLKGGWDQAQILQGLLDLLPFEHGLTVQELQAPLHDLLRSMAKGASQAIVKISSSLPSALLQMVLASLTCFFLLMDGAAFNRWCLQRLPISASLADLVASTFRNTAISVVWATTAAAAAQSFLMFIGFLVCGIPAAFLAGGMTFIFAFIPLLGSTPIWVTACVYLATQDNWGYVFGMGLLGLFTSFIDNFIRPWILKGRSEIHPLVSLIAVFGGIQTLGLFGVFLGPIFAALLITLLHIWPDIGREAGLEFAKNSGDGQRIPGADDQP